MIDDALVEGLRQRYSHVNPLIFWRSLEKARTPGDLFDILEGIPVEFPIAWNEEGHCWNTVERLPT